MSHTPRWRDLETRGFLVVPGFLAGPEIDALLAGFDEGRPPQDYPFGFKLIGRAPIKAAWSRIEPALAEIRAQTSIKADVLNFLTLSHYITTRFAERSSLLHQDFDLDYKLTRDHVNYLNFWIPLRKPEPTKSNVTLIPFDALRAKAPAVDGLLVGAGGYRFVPRNGTTAIFGKYGSILSADDSVEPERVLDFDLEEIALTPSLDAGDLLLMRGDLIHRTQDTDTDRVAASLRVTYSGKVILRERSGVDDSAAESNKGAANVRAMLRQCFDALGKTSVTMEEFIAFSRGNVAT
jgi:ectoine hydroxylase-related dioxygenase (phytanoyl-CoA dioxygenase family)